MMTDSYFTNSAVLHSFLSPSDDRRPPARRALQELPHLSHAESSAEARRVCEDWARRQDNDVSGNARIFGLAVALYGQRTSACRGAAERVLQALTQPGRVGVTANQRLAAALILDSMGKLREARAVLGRGEGGDATVHSANGDVLSDAYAYERQRLNTRLDWWPWLCRRVPAALPKEIAFADPQLGAVSLSLAVGCGTS